MSPQDLARQLFEGVADDERLRGELTDAGYGPLLSWCASRAAALATASAGAPEGTLADGLRSAVRAVVQAAESGEPASLEGIDPGIVDPAARARAIAALAAAPPDPDGRAQVMVRALEEAGS